MQTGKLERFPIIGMGGAFWDELRTFGEGTLVAAGTISQSDLDIMQRAESAAQALQMIESR